jgi:hypothetical protein
MNALIGTGSRGPKESPGLDTDTLRSVFFHFDLKWRQTGHFRMVFIAPKNLEAFILLFRHPSGVIFIQD